METKPEYEFVALLAREAPQLSFYAVATLAQDLMRLARRHQHLAVADCNGYQDQNLQDRADSETARLRVRITQICADLGWTAKCGGDPRGYTVKIIFSSGASNTWGGREDGWGVPS